MTETGSGCSQLQKALVVGESDKVESGGGSCGRREGHFVKAGELWLFTPAEDLTVYKQTWWWWWRSQRTHMRPAGWKHFSFHLSLTSRKWKRETKPVFSWFSKSAAHSIFLEPCAWAIPSWAVISHFAPVEPMKSRGWKWVLRGTARDGLPLRRRRQHLERARRSWAGARSRALSSAALSRCWVMGRKYLSCEDWQGLLACAQMH